MFLVLFRLGVMAYQGTLLYQGDFIFMVNSEHIHQNGHKSNSLYKYFLTEVSNNKIN